jgi:hypothetical protein
VKSVTDLKTITDSKDGDTKVEYGGVDTRSVVVIDGVGRSGEDNTCRCGSPVGQKSWVKMEVPWIVEHRAIVESAHEHFRMMTVLRKLTLGLPTEILHLGSTRLHLTVDLHGQDPNGDDQYHAK